MLGLKPGQQSGQSTQQWAAKAAGGLGQQMGNQVLAQGLFHQRQGLLKARIAAQIVTGQGVLQIARAEPHLDPRKQRGLILGQRQALVEEGRAAGFRVAGSQGDLAARLAVHNGQAILVNLPDGVTFDVNSTAIKPQFRTTLDQIAQSLQQYPNSLVDVYGHTDSTGSDAYNQSLSENRARSVGNYLTMRGVSAARLRTMGFGETQPIASNDTEEGRARNRRVEIKIIPISAEEAATARSAR